MIEHNQFEKQFSDWSQTDAILQEGENGNIDALDDDDWAELDNHQGGGDGNKDTMLQPNYYQPHKQDECYKIAPERESTNSLLFFFFFF